MSFLKWFKENVFDWSAEPPSRFTRPPEHDPGYYNRQRAKRANKGLHTDWAKSPRKSKRSTGTPRQ